MDIDDRFASKAVDVEETPEPFRRALLQNLSPDEPVNLLVYGPAFSTMDLKMPATVLALTNRRWLIVSEEQDESPAVHECDFSDTLLLELTSVLLSWQLKIDFIKDGATRFSTVQFHGAMGAIQNLYRPAIELVLNRISETASGTLARKDNTAILLDGWPAEFRNVALQYLPGDRHLVCAAHWPATSSGFKRELTPAGALLLTARELVLIAERPLPWARLQEHEKLGIIITYFPLIRLAQFNISHHERLSILGLEMHASHGGEKLEIVFPSEHEQALLTLMEQAGI
jgi:hypothetical protein